MDITALVTNGYLHMIGGGVVAGPSPVIVDADEETPTITGSGLDDPLGPVISGSSTQVPSITDAQETVETEPTAPSIVGSKVEKPGIR